MTDAVREALEDALQELRNLAVSERGTRGREAREAVELISQALTAAPGWRDISTAPVNESILIYVPGYEHYGPGVLRAILVDMGTGRRWHSTAYACGRDLPATGDLSPTHWQPLPQPPEPKP